jgi:hypothetical protein
MLKSNSKIRTQNLKKNKIRATYHIDIQICVCVCVCVCVCIEVIPNYEQLNRKLKTINQLNDLIWILKFAIELIQVVEIKLGKEERDNHQEKSSTASAN